MSTRAQRLLEAARKLEVAEPPALAAIRGEVGARTRRASQWLAFAVAIPLGAAAAAGGWAVHERVVRSAPVEPRPVPPPAREHTVREPVGAVQPEVPSEGAAEAAIASAPPVARAVGAPPARRVTSEPVVAAAPSPSESPRTAVEPPAPTELSEEAALLSEALAALRGRHDAQAALDAVARYRVHFADGVLAAEMTLAAAEAHRSLGRTAQALAELDQLSSDPLHGELSVLRAELRAELGRCEAARLDLAGSLDTLPDALRRRALFTDASCAATLGARDEAVARLEALLALDPADARARDLLEQLK